MSKHEFKFPNYFIFIINLIIYLNNLFYEFISKDAKDAKEQNTERLPKCQGWTFELSYHPA